MGTVGADGRQEPDAMLRAMLDASLEGHALWLPVLDDQGHLADLVCAYLNPAGEKISGQRAEDIVGRRLLRAAAEAGNAEFGKAMFQVAATGVPLRQRSKLATGNGREYWVDYVAVRWVGGLSLSGRDVTEEVRLHAKLEATVEALTRLASTDPLTGLDNRRAWTQALAAHLERAATDSQPLVVAMLDLDQFKAYNDRHGHLAGDELLCEVATRWRRSLPSAASLARLGGEEFAVALPGVDLLAAKGFLIELCELTPAGQTSSAGLTVWDGSESASSLLGRADAALYAAKHAGRNRVEALLPL